MLARRDIEQSGSGPAGRVCAAKTGRPALVLSFAAAGLALEDSLIVGTDLDADLVFYPGAVPLRAVVLAKHDATGGGPPDGDTIAGLLGFLRGRARRDPWLDNWPAVLHATPARSPSRPSPTRTATPCGCTPAPATAGRCSRSPAAAW